MEFILQPDNRNASDEDLINDLKRVANELWKNSVSRKEYDNLWIYSSSTIINRLWWWNNAIWKSELKPIQQYNITKKDIILEINRIANLLKKESITREDFNCNKKVSNSHTIENLFWSWNNALKESWLLINLKQYTEEELSENLLEVWTYYGRQPTYWEMWEYPSIINWQTYSRKFWWYRKALEAFVDYINKENSDIDNNVFKDIENEQEIKKEEEIKHKTSRTINWRLRFIVLKRDNFKCKICWRSPATDHSVILHVDHIKAWANWWETVLENLQSLCSVCNIWKSDLE